MTDKIKTVAKPDTITLSKADLEKMLSKAIAAGRDLGAAPAGPWQDPMLTTRKYHKIVNEAGEVVCEPPFIDADGRLLGGGGPTSVGGEHPDDYFAVDEKDGVYTATQNHK